MAAELAKVISINPEAEREERTLTLYEQATSLTITDQASYVAAGELGQALKALEMEISDYFEPLRINAKAAYGAVLDKKNRELLPVKEAMKAVRITLNAWAQGQERLRWETERQARTEAVECARKDRKLLTSQALAAFNKGNVEKAESLIESAALVHAEPVEIAPLVVKTIRTASGNITQARELDITITDPANFLQALVDRHPHVVSSIVKIGDGPLKSWVRANEVDTFPGLRIEQTVGVRI